MSREEQLRIQALGAALSRRDWHATEQAYNAIRDEFDHRPQRSAAIVAAPTTSPEPDAVREIIAKDPRDQKLELVEGGLVLLLSAVKAGDPPREIIWRIEDELRVLRGAPVARNERQNGEPRS